MIWNWYHDIGYQSLSDYGLVHRAGLQLVDALRRLADPNHHHEALTTRSLLPNAVGRQTRHAGQVRLTVISSHSRREQVKSALEGIAKFFGNRKAVNSVRTMGADPQLRAAKVSARPQTAAATEPAAGLRRYRGLKS